MNVIERDGAIEMFPLKDMGDLKGNQPMSIFIGKPKGIRCLSSLKLQCILSIEILIMDDVKVILVDLEV